MCEDSPPSLPEERQHEAVGRVESVVTTLFCTHFGSHPRERYDDLFVQMATFASHLSRDHIFPDGNKRTTVKATLSLLRFAGVEIRMKDSDNADENELCLWIRDVVVGSKGIRELADTLRGSAVFEVEDYC